METPRVAAAVWLLAGIDPVLIATAVLLGWKADQFGKVFIAAIVALAASVLASFAITSMGLPWPAPVGRDHPTLFPVRTVAAFLWGAAAFGVRRTLASR